MSKHRKAKSKKSKRKSAEMERPTDQEEEESALTLMQMSEAPVQHSKAPYYEKNHAFPAQFVPQSSPMRPSIEPVRKSKIGKTNEKTGKKERVRADIWELTSAEEYSSGAEQYPDVPSTPPGQTDPSSPSPYRPAFPPVNALDEIPTDDDDVAAYEEYAKDTASADPPGLPDHDIFSFSQQPSNPFDQDVVEHGMQGSPQLPTHVYSLPESPGKHKRKRKRRTDHQENFAHEQGQHVPHFDAETFDDFLQITVNSADLSSIREGDSMPIDPELHSMNAPALSADSSNLTNEDPKTLRKNEKDFGTHGSSQPRKRRRLEELQGANTTDLPYMSPYSFQHDQENIKDQVLPGFEDMQRQSLSGLGSPFSDNAAHQDSIFSGDGAQARKSVRRKKKDQTTTPKSKQERQEKQKDEKTEHAKKDKAENGGSFSTVEAFKLDAFRDNHCEANNMTIWQFNSLIQTPMRGNAQVTALFNEIHDILPYRPRMSVQKFCRRRFHNFSRGTWVAEEDDLLKDAVAVKGKAWKEIGESLGRMPEDCRDRWRNYLVNSEHRNREQWTDAEVVNLCSAILECMQLMKEDRMQAREEGEDIPESGTESDQAAEDMKHINWQAVSDRMGEHGGGRSRLQCSFKWGQLKKREQAEYLKAIKESREIGKKEHTPAKNPWRMKLASKKIANMKPGDIHALLQAVLDANVPEEGNIPWRSLGDDEFRAMWTSTDKKIAWSRLKEKALGSESVDYRSIATEMLSWVTNRDPNALNERWDPQVHGDVNAKQNGKRKKYTRRKSKGKENQEVDETNGYLQRSNEFVNDSDDMDGDAENQAGLGAFEPQDYNRYNALSMADGMDGGMNASNGIGSMHADADEDMFHDGRNAHGHLPMADGEVSPEFAGRLQSALNGYT